MFVEVEVPTIGPHTLCVYTLAIIKCKATTQILLWYTTSETNKNNEVTLTRAAKFRMPASRVAFRNLPSSPYVHPYYSSHINPLIEFIRPAMDDRGLKTRACVRTPSFHSSFKNLISRIKVLEYRCLAPISRHIIVAFCIFRHKAFFHLTRFNWRGASQMISFEVIWITWIQSTGNYWMWSKIVWCELIKLMIKLMTSVQNEEKIYMVRTNERMCATRARCNSCRMMATNIVEGLHLSLFIFTHHIAWFADSAPTNPRPFQNYSMTSFIPTLSHQNILK